MNKDSIQITNLKELDKSSFVTVIYNRYGKKLYSYAIKSWSLNEDTAWDLIYKTIYKVADSHMNYTFESEEKFSSFIFKIFINYLRNHYRDNKVAKAFEFTAMNDVDVSSKEVTGASEKPNKKLIALNEALDEMQDWERMLLLMRSEGRAYSEIATYIDKPENQLKVYYQRLKEQVTKKLNGKSY
ncbi:MAG TPA: sigma-70 family RNA polymerase sigma factor [Bacteroidia bacterium]|nr:sigma-70 family RNA polymerase sigma factor [Bacteroidia bacterium]